jgi:hypothetical protein
MAKGHKTGGRQKGSLNRTTKEQREAVAQSGETPLDFMLRVMRDKTADQSRREAMAVAAAPYVHARLASTSVVSDNQHHLSTDVPKSCFDDFLREAIAAAAAPDAAPIKGEMELGDGARRIALSSGGR